MSEKSRIVNEFSCFIYKNMDTGEKEWFGIEIEPTSNIDEAILIVKEKAKEKNDVVIYASGYYFDGNSYSKESDYVDFDTPIRLN